MITVEYLIYEAYENFPYPVVIKETKNNGEIIMAELVRSREAEAAGIDSNEYIALHASYMSAYIAKLSNMDDLSYAAQALLSVRAMNATTAYVEYMEGRWLGF